jgi:hypothetical protein
LNMANIARVNGFKPVKYLNGAPWNGQCRAYVIPAADGTATFVGDAVKFTGAGADITTGLATCVQAAASNQLLGVIVGIEPNGGTSLGGRYMTNGAVALDLPGHRLASTRRIVYVVDDPNVIFEVQEDGDTTPIPMADIGLNINIIVGAGSTTTGNSGMQLDSSSVATTNTLPITILAAVPREDNELITAGQANTRWLVKINSHQRVAVIGNLGVA